MIGNRLASAVWLAARLEAELEPDVDPKIVAAVGRLHGRLEAHYQLHTAAPWWLRWTLRPAERALLAEVEPILGRLDDQLRRWDLVVRAGDVYRVPRVIDRTRPRTGVM